HATFHAQKTKRGARGLNSKCGGGGPAGRAGRAKAQDWGFVMGAGRGVGEQPPPQARRDNIAPASHLRATRQEETMGTITDTTGWQTKILWIGVAVLGAVSFGIVALNRGEAVNAAWLVVAAVCVYFVAYRCYELSVATVALGVDGTRPTPAFRHNDGLDYVPTNRYVLYGHHFAAIAGAGPLVGP